MHQLDPIPTKTVEAAIRSAAQLQGGVFAFPEAAALVRSIGPDIGSRRLQAVLDQLVEIGVALRIERGRYVLVDALGRMSPLAIGAYLVPAGYVSLWSAAFYYGFSTQDVETVSVITTVKKARLEVPEIGASFVFHKTTPHRIFGWHEEPTDGVFARLADRERVLIDLLYFQGTRGVPRGPQIRAIWEAARSTVNPFVLVDYTRRLGSSTLARRVGYLMDELSLGPTDALLEWRARDRTAIPLFLGGASSAKGSARWGIQG